MSLRVTMSVYGRLFMKKTALFLTTVMLAAMLFSGCSIIPEPVTTTSDLLRYNISRRNGADRCRYNPF